MRKIIALLVLLSLVMGCASSAYKAPTDERSIQRSKEAHRDLDDNTR